MTEYPRIEDAPLPIGMGGFFYLATVYTIHPGGKDMAYEHAAVCAAYLLKRGIKVFCPITHAHTISKLGILDDTHEFWMDLNTSFMRVSAGLIIAKMPDWERSRGISQEIEFFQARNSPIYTMEWPIEVPPGGIMAPTDAA